MTCALLGGLLLIAVIYFSETVWHIGCLQSFAFILSLVADGVMNGLGVKNYNNPDVTYLVIGLAGALVFGIIAAFWQFILKASKNN